MARKRSDVMKTLADARPPEFDPERLAGSERARNDLNTILSSAPDAPEARRSARSPRPFTWRWALPVAATAAAAGVLVATLPQGGSGSDGSRATARPSTDGPRHTPENGRLALRHVANRLESEADEGTYWQTTTRSGWIGIVAESGSTFAVAASETQQWSFGVRPGTQSLWVSGIDDTTEPRTARDAARWRAAGSPKDLTLAETGPRSGGKLALRIESGSEKRPTVTRINDGDKIAALGARNVTYADLWKLPADTAKLKEYLEGLYEEDRGSEISGRTEWMWRQAAGLIGLPVRPEVRAAAYRVIADLPGIRSLGEVTDPLGREGVGFALPATERPDYGTARSELIVDPATGALLSDQQVLTKPNAQAAEAGLTAGTVVNHTATVTSKWTDQQLKAPK
ncbi:CU044_5270 family protein [Streptomyces sp. NBS 14/10]|uniref:CU044_5270 family protein n=1 Tax=Streptomyces sp. NBS 14/10 TaxID=1945643 RepID=UPI000B7EFBD8|nr:CU044_5270 family protein [Streptomyces sp. NBS 14/10]KAK1179028.1 CU044_5270 family protein [Streptomyces sp. NBS 14/10]